MRDSDQSFLNYYTIMDGDVLNFNGVFSAYKRIVESNDLPPTVMTTGYLFSEKGEGNWPYHYASLVDMAIRRITNKYFETGVYFPEPNTCILIPDGEETLPESFIDKSTKNKNLESPAVLRNVLLRNSTNQFHFSNDNALITATPERCKLYKHQKKVLNFSETFKAKGSPTQKDLYLLKSISQCHLDERCWAESLYYNRGFKLKGVDSFRKFTAKITELFKILEKDNDHKGLNEISNFLINYLNTPESIVSKIIDAAKEITLYKKNHLNYFPNFDQQLEFARQDFNISKEKLSSLDRKNKELLLELYEMHFYLTDKLINVYEEDIIEIIDFYNSTPEHKFTEIENVVLNINIEGISIENMSELYNQLEKDNNISIYMNYLQSVKLIVDENDEYDAEDKADIIAKLITYNDKELVIEFCSYIGEEEVIELLDNNEILDVINLYKRKIDFEIALKLLIYCSIQDIVKYHDNNIDLEILLSLIEDNTETIEEIVSIQERESISLADIFKLQKENSELTLDEIVTLVRDFKIEINTLIQLSELNGGINFKEIKDLTELKLDLATVIERQINDSNLTLDMLDDEMSREAMGQDGTSISNEIS